MKYQLGTAGNMTAKYLVRLDDACPTSNWKTWREAEAILDAHGIRPSSQ